MARGRKGRRIIAAALLLAAGAQPLPTQAQFIDQSNIAVPPRQPRNGAGETGFRQDRDIAVLDRARPELSAQGLPIGPFRLYPGLELGAEGISNLYADNDRKHHDLALFLRPEATLRNEGGPVDLDVYARGKVTRFVDHGHENQEEFVTGADIGADVGPLARLSAGGRYGQRVLPRWASDSPRDILKPLEYQEFAGNVAGSVETGRIRLSGEGEVARLRFDNGVNLAGDEVFARDRDRTVTSGLARVGFAVKPNTSLYIAGSANRVDYRLDPPQVPLRRDSHGWGAFLGLRFDLTHLMRGDVRVGYIRQMFRAPGARNVSGLGLKGEIQYFPTQLTTVTLRGERSVQDSGVPDSSGFIKAGGELQADHELRRYILLSGLIGHFDYDYRGVFRHEKNSYAAVTATYVSRHHAQAKLGYQYNRRRCRCTTTSTDFDDHRLLASLTLQY